MKFRLEKVFLRGEDYMENEKEKLLKNIRKYESKHIVGITKKHFSIARAKPISYKIRKINGDEYLIFFDYYNHKEEYEIKKEVLEYGCSDFYEYLNLESGYIYTFNINHFRKAFLKFKLFLLDVKKYYEEYMYPVNDKNKENKKSSEFEDIYELIDSIK